MWSSQNFIQIFAQGTLAKMWILDILVVVTFFELNLESRMLLWNIAYDLLSMEKKSFKTQHFIFHAFSA